MLYDRILINPKQLEEAVTRLAGEISTFYSDTGFTALILLEGAKYFAKDLLDKVNPPFEQTFIRVSSYCGTASGDTVTINADEDLREKLYGKNLLVIDDIYDTGKTLSHLLKWLKNCEPKSIKTCVLLEKEIEHAENITIDFMGPKVPDAFVVGYGLDFNGQHRELPFIAELASERVGE